MLVTQEEGRTARLDAELVRRGLARSRGDAVRLVAAGRVRVDGAAAHRPSRPVQSETELVVERAADDPGYASRAAHKLAGALDALAALDGSATLDTSGALDASGALEASRALDGPGVGVDVDGSLALDLGASTGGFTDVLLRRGARRVVAVDVGHDQLVERLRADARVDVREGVNARHLAPDDLPGVPDVVVGDLSFIGWPTVLPALAAVTGPASQVLLLVKPQFEVGRERLGSGGVVRDPELHVSAVLGVVRAAAAVGLALVAVVASPLPGPHGNREIFVRLAPGGAPPHDRDVLAAVRAAVRDAARMPLAADDPATPPVPQAFGVRAADGTGTGAGDTGADGTGTGADAGTNEQEEHQ